MNPEGKLHDWTDVPEDDLPELQQMGVGVGDKSAEMAHNLVENLQACKGRGKIPVAVPLSLKQQPQHQVKGPFASSFRQVFDSRRGLFEPKQSAVQGQTVNKVKVPSKIYQFEQHTLNNNTQPNPNPWSRFPQDFLERQTCNSVLSRSSTAPGELVAPATQQLQQATVSPQRQLPPSPSVPRRASSKKVLAQYKSSLNSGTFATNFASQQENDKSRPPLRNFFGFS